MRWLLIVVELLLGSIMAPIGFVYGIGMGFGGADASVKAGTAVWLSLIFAAVFPAVAVSAIGWLGPTPHGGFLLTLAASAIGTYLTFLVTGYREARKWPLWTVIVALPIAAIGSTLAYNWAWLLA